MMMDLAKVRNALSTSINLGTPDNLKTKLASVMIIIYDKEPVVLMTKRPKTMNLHAGEISFPGGSWHQEDKDLMDTARRETREELGIDIARNQVIGQLKPVTTLNSGFTITPFITIPDMSPSITPNSEIESILRIPLIPLLQTIEEDKDPHHISIQEMYTFTFANHLIWGASARILKQILTIFSAHGIV
jgi:8-oxo-dGTP pyrophosphatase MutT (NUDIX family)